MSLNQSDIYFTVVICVKAESLYFYVYTVKVHVHAKLVKLANAYFFPPSRLKQQFFLPKN